MGRSEIITELYNSKEFNDTIRKMNPQHLQDDLKSEVMLILCEKNEEELKSIYESGGLKYYTVRIILNLIQSSTSPFYKKFRNQGHDLSVLRDFTSYDVAAELSDSIDVNNIQLANYAVRYANLTIDNSEDENIKQLQECTALDEVNNLYWYDKEIIKLYLRLGTYRAVEEETGIPWESVYKTIRKACAKIKLKVA